MTQLDCHKCPYNNKHSEQCLTCTKDEQTLKFRQYVCDGYDTPQPDTSCSEPCTNLGEDVEDAMRKFLYTIFDLTPNELLCLQAIMRQKPLVEFAHDMEKLAKKNQSFSRYRAFQTRKAILKKLGHQAAPALLTVGQKKELS